MKKYLKSTIVLTLMMFSSLCIAGGFEVLDHGARATGQANAFTARASDPSAIWYNPAGITQLKGTHIYVGASGLLHDPEISSEAYDDIYITDNDLSSLRVSCLRPLVISS